MNLQKLDSTMDPLLIWVQLLQIVRVGAPFGEEGNQVTGGLSLSLSRYPGDGSRSRVLSLNR